MSNIAAIIGLGNPGNNYQDTRHNAGVWAIDAIAEQYPVTWKLEKKLFCQSGQFYYNNNLVRLFKPTTYMNESGTAIMHALKYYSINLDNTLIAHDDIDLEIGKIKLKYSGGHGGHNGLRDIIRATGGNKNFTRLRIGVGKPAHKHEVHNYVLTKPSAAEMQLINNGIDNTISLLPELLQGNLEIVMNKLHTRK